MRWFRLLMVIPTLLAACGSDDAAVPDAALIDANPKEVDAMGPSIPAPAVALTGTPPHLAVTASRLADFSFTSEPSTTFECRRDGGPYAPCTSPQQFEVKGADGVHSFAVRGISAAGVVGEAVGHVWTLDTTGPITARP